MMTRIFGFLPGVWAEAGAESIPIAATSTNNEQIFVMPRIFILPFRFDRSIVRVGPAPLVLRGSGHSPGWKVARVVGGDDLGTLITLVASALARLRSLIAAGMQLRRRSVAPSGTSLYFGNESW